MTPLRKRGTEVNLVIYILSPLATPYHHKKKSDTRPTKQIHENEQVLKQASIWEPSIEVPGYIQGQQQYGTGVHPENRLANIVEDHGKELTDIHDFLLISSLLFTICIRSCQLRTN